MLATRFFPAGLSELAASLSHLQSDLSRQLAGRRRIQERSLAESNRIARIRIAELSMCDGLKNLS